MDRQVIVARTYIKAANRLRSYRKQIDEKLHLFSQNPHHSSLKLHQLDRVESGEWWSYYVNMDVRTILSDQKDCWVVCYVGHHDDAYQWARRKRFSVDLLQGSYSLAPPASEVVLEKPIAEASPENAPRRPLSGYTVKDLIRLGIPQQNEDWAQRFINATEDELQHLLSTALDEDWFSQDVTERLWNLAFGGARYQELLPPQVSLLMTSELLRRYPRNFWAPESEAEIERAIRSNWQEWIIFLHPAQKAAVERDMQGAIRIRGGAGTGKTVVAAHRTAWLATRYPDEQVLLTTFTRVLAENLRRRVEQIIGSLEGTMITVATLHSVAYSMFKRHLQRNEAVVDDFNPLLREAIQRVGSEYDLAFMRAEWETIIEPWNVRTLEKYRTIERIGRRTQLQIAQREKLWPVFEQMWQLLAEHGQITYGGICYAVAEYLQNHPEARYRCVVVDEAQDFGPAELTLIRALAPPDEENSLFLCADFRQRIYRPAVPWIRFGIDTRGRSYTLRVNYRTTAQIQHFAESVLPSQIEDGEENKAVAPTDRPFALLRGIEPEIKAYDNIRAEMSGLKQWIYHCLNENIQPGEIAIFARTKQVRDEVRKLLQEVERERGIYALELSRDMQPIADKLNYGTAHNAKGLEFRAVAVVGVSSSNFPCYAVVKDVADPAERSLKEAEERQLLYTVCTRARERLYISYAPAASPSPFLKR